MESYQDLERKLKILERELELQRQALDRLKQLQQTRDVRPQPVPGAVRKSA